MLWLIVALLAALWFAPSIIILLLQLRSEGATSSAGEASLRFEARFRYHVNLYFFKNTSATMGGSSRKDANAMGATMGGSVRTDASTVGAMVGSDRTGANSTGADIVGLRRGKNFYVYACSYVWQGLTTREQEALLLWLGFVDFYSSPLERLFFKPQIRASDRETVLALGDAAAWQTVIERLKETTQNRIGGSWWAGLSMLGPSLLATWPSPAEREQSISRYLAQQAAAR